MEPETVNKCPYCGSEHIEFRNDDFDYDGNVWTWDIYLCLDCNQTFNIDTNNPYEDEQE